MQHSIPTIYAGIQMRSRLEARWAAFFDALHWSWIYEPCDFNGWIPDFGVTGHNADGMPSMVYIEVKPATWLPEDTAREIDRSGCADEAVIVGISPSFDSHAIRIGWMRENVPTEDGPSAAWDWSECVMGRWAGDESKQKNRDSLIGFCHSVQSYRDRITGCYDGGCYGVGADPTSSIRHAWAMASNASQWKAPA